ncbi:pitrilysin family protein [Hyphomonas sp. KY3]|uniref:M16 family metallopeptidase n=1 Tax=Hyphomonas sp. KY3 TaxID=2016196 RepID=UPI001A8FDA3E|nr:pitrilysin family protein [Hyphomonas sp. KY3]QSR21698.1 peptidase M16 [Hyphomonas sp. KY3]
MKPFDLIIGAALGVGLAACASVETQDDLANVADTAPAKLVEDSGLDIVVHEGDFAEIQQFTTPGGVSVWLVSEPSIPILSVAMAWEGGEAADPEGLEGLADAVVYHMNEGAGDLDSLAFQTRMEELNMSFGCSASSDWTSCAASMLTDNADEAMSLVAQAFEAPRFDAGPFARFQREREVSLNTRETNARYLAGRAEAQAIYPDHPYARETSAESIAALTPELAKAHMRKLMVKDSLIVTAVGAITPEELAPMLDAIAESLPESNDLPETPEITFTVDGAFEPVLIDLPQPQSLVRFLAPGLKREDPDFFTAYVVNYTYGGGGFGSRLMESLRVQKGLTYGVYTWLSFDDTYQNWGGSGQTKNESVGEFVEALLAETALIAEEGITAEELADAKAYLTGSYPLAFDSNAKIAGQMMSVRQDELGVDYFDRRNALIEAVTLEDANRVAAEFLQPDRFSFIMVGQPEGLD